MVARTPSKQRKPLASIDPSRLRETLKKVDKCMATLHEIQSTVTKSVDKENHNTLRLKQERLKKQRGSPLKKTKELDWRRMSLQAMLVGETVGEIVQASKFAKEIPNEDPRTPDYKIRAESSPSEKSRRKREKIEKLQIIRSEHKSSPHRRTRSRIIFKPSPSKKSSSEDEIERGKARCSASKVGRNAVLFPNQLFVPGDSIQQQKFYKTRSPVIARAKAQTPNKFLIKSPRPVSKYQVKVRSPPKIACLSPPDRKLVKKMGVRVTGPSEILGKGREGLVKRAESPNVVAKLRRSLSPARIAARFISPLRIVQKNGDGFLKRGHIMVTPKKFELVKV